MLKQIKILLVPLSISLISYLVYFYPLLDSGTTIYSGKDAIRLHYASRYFLYDSLKSSTYPSWTFRMFNGYPIYADLERGYQNILNLTLVFIFGPINSYKIIHFGFYLLGSLCLYFILKRHGGNYLTFTAGNLLYFFSFFPLIHQQHFNIVISMYSLPLIILLSLKFLEKSEIKYLVILSVINYFLFTLGSIQALLIVISIQIAYLSCFARKFKNLVKALFLDFALSFLLCLPALVSFLRLYLSSQRSSINLLGQGNLDFSNIYTFIYPFIFGNLNYIGETLNSNYVKNEYSLYLGISAFLISTLVLIFTKNLELRKFSLISLLLFIATNLLPIPPFSFFRYWVRGDIYLIFTEILLLNELYQNYDFYQKKISRFYIFALGLIFIPLSLNRNLQYILKLSIQENYLIPAIWVFCVIGSLIILNYVKSKKFIVFLVIFDILFFNYFLHPNLFMKVADISYESINSSPGVSTENDECTLFKNNISSSGYGGLVPATNLDFEMENNFYTFIQKLYIFVIAVYLVILGIIYRYRSKIL